MSSYSDALRDPRWQKKRLQVLNNYGWTCLDCGADQRTLHVHHLRYRRGAKPWEYEDYDLLALCTDCHSYRHSVHSRLKESLAELEACGGIEAVMGVLGYALSQLDLLVSPDMRTPPDNAHELAGYRDGSDHV